MAHESISAPHGVVFCLPTASTRNPGPSAAWITTAGWARGAIGLGPVWIVVRDRIFSVDAAETFHDNVYTGSGSIRPRWRRAIPELATTLVKDVRQMAMAPRKRAMPRGPWLDRRPLFVWQRHSPFCTSGLHLARRLGRPFVLSVHSLAVREAASWGVRRPGWSFLTEQFGEARIFRRADLLACVSLEVAAQVKELGVAPERIVVAPNGVDLDDFRPNIDGTKIRQQHNLDGMFVVGWVGSFRQFHGIEMALRAVANLQGRGRAIGLLLVGDGNARPAYETLARDLGIKGIRFAGAVPHKKIPQYLAAMDATLALARPGEKFHYSPVKLREYMACGRPVIANPSGEMGRILEDRKTALLPPAGDLAALERAIEELADDGQLADDVAASAYVRVQAVGSWPAQVDQVVSRLRDLGYTDLPHPS